MVNYCLCHQYEIAWIAKYDLLGYFLYQAPLSLAWILDGHVFDMEERTQGFQNNKKKLINFTEWAFGFVSTRYFSFENKLV